MSRSSRAAISRRTAAARSTSGAARDLSASGERLLVSLRVKAREKKSWFGFGTEATVHVWGKPALDQENQILRLTDISLAVESEAAFGLLGTAARAAMPYVQKALADKAVIDLKPFANDAQAQSIERRSPNSAGRRRRAGRHSRNGLRLTGMSSIQRRCA